MERQAILFDFDGVLVPTEHLYADAHAATVCQFGGKVCPYLYGEIKGVGKSHELVRRAFIRISGITVQEDEYSRMFRAILAKRLEMIKPTPGIPEILKKLHDSYWRLAVVSSSPTGKVHSILARLNLLECFAITVCGNEVVKKKPSPEPYLLALKRLCLGREQVLAVEDSESGVVSARDAGIRVIGLRHKYNHDHDFSDAWEIVSSTEELHGVLHQITGKGDMR